MLLSTDTDMRVLHGTSSLILASFVLFSPSPASVLLTIGRLLFMLPSCPPFRNPTPPFFSASTSPLWQIWVRRCSRVCILARGRGLLRPRWLPTTPACIYGGLPRATMPGGSPVSSSWLPACVGLVRNRRC